MSSIPSTTEHPAGHSNRRLSPRERYKELVYVDLGRNNGGMLLNVSEGGIAFQAIQPVAQDQPPHVEFTLPGIGDSIDVTGHIVWLDDAGTCGGLQFLDLPPATLQTLVRGLAFCKPSNPLEGALSLQPLDPEGDPPPRSATVDLVATHTAQPGSTAPVGLDPSKPAKVRSNEPQETDELALPASGALASRGLPRHSHGEELVQNSSPARLRERAPSKPQSKQDQGEELPRPNLRTLPFTFMVASGCFVLLATIAGMLFFRSSLSRATPLPTNPPAAQPPTPSQAAAQPPATSVPAQTFRIEVVESNDKRWALVPGTEAASGNSVQSSPQRIQQTRPVTSQLKHAANPQRWAPPALRIPQRSPASVGSPRDASVAVPDSAAPSLPGISGPSPALLNPHAVIPTSPDSVLSPSRPAPLAGNQPAVLLKRVEPVYSSQAKLLRLEGPVQVSAVIGQDGRPKDLKVVHGNMILGQLALNAIQQWRYKPSTLHGVPIEQPADITVIFRYVQ